MKKFFIILFIWIIIMILFTFMFAWFFIDTQHFYRLPVLIAFIFSIITYSFYVQCEKIEKLNARIDELKTESDKSRDE